jgi:hypothetical protein
MVDISPARPSESNDLLSYLHSKGDLIFAGYDLSQARRRKIVAGWSMPVGSTVLLPVRLPAKLAPAYPAGASFLPDAVKARGAA